MRRYFSPATLVFLSLLFHSRLSPWRYLSFPNLLCSIPSRPTVAQPVEFVDSARCVRLLLLLIIRYGGFYRLAVCMYGDMVGGHVMSVRNIISRVCSVLCRVASHVVHRVSHGIDRRSCITCHQGTTVAVALLVILCNVGVTCSGRDCMGIFSIYRTGISGCDLFYFFIRFFFCPVLLLLLSSFTLITCVCLLFVESRPCLNLTPRSTYRASGNARYCIW